MQSCFTKLLVALIMCLTTFKADAQGLGDWQHETPGNNIMGDNGTGTFLQMKGNQKEISHIRRWYFYKNHIIGKTDSLFFDVDEAKNSVKKFQKESTYTQYLSQNSLKPGIWTRWYLDN